MQGYVVDVHAVAHPQTCDNCDKEFFSVDSLQGHVADVYENGEPMYEDQTQAHYKSGHSWFEKQKLKPITTWGELHIQLKYPKQPRN